MGKLYEKVADSRKWMVDLLALVVIVLGLVGLVTRWFEPGK